MRLPIGYDNFAELIEHNFDFVDKSLFIKKLIDNDSDKVTMITRPRRFGKTLNLSMLRYFLAAEVRGIRTKELFNNLKITKIDNGEYLKYQGKFPVIFITFREVDLENYDLAYDKLCSIIARAFNEHGYLESSDKISKRNKNLFNNILDEKGGRIQIEESIQILTECLFEHYGVKPWLLIDEYDTPIQASYLNNYYEPMIRLMRNMLGAALKSNDCLERGVITGILRIAKESIFSGLNNLTVYSILSPEYSEYFGFTEDEVTDLLEQANLQNQAEEIKKWYNGYIFGNTTIYNPWSIVNCVKSQGKVEPYWINTSDNDLIKDLLIHNRGEFQEKFEILLQGKEITSNLDEHTVFVDLRKDYTAAWNLLAMSGYLKVIESHLTDTGEKLGQLAIPNFEVYSLYRNIIKTWLSNDKSTVWYDNFLKHLLSGEIEKFEEKLKEVLISTISYYDTAQQPEAFYHGFLLGLIVSLDKSQYEVKSNKESGQGRYDILIIAKELANPSIILELKSIKATEDLGNKLIDGAKEALEQINRLGYVAELQKLGVANIIKLGIAFSGKELSVHWEK
jgi:hypothetical protein